MVCRSFAAWRQLSPFVAVNGNNVHALVTFGDHRRVAATACTLWKQLQLKLLENLLYEWHIQWVKTSTNVSETIVSLTLVITMFSPNNKNMP